MDAKIHNYSIMEKSYYSHMLKYDERYLPKNETVTAVEITTKKEKPNMLRDVDYNTIPGCF